MPCLSISQQRSSSVRKSFLLEIVDLNDAIKNLMYKESDGSWTCSECNFNTKYHTTLKNHIEAKHLRAAEGYYCQHCNKYCPTKNALKCHTYRTHSQKQNTNYN
eukprot:TRINITY_DN37545_c0_g1_i2.p2 TRINITY_DN37545_c0_g1~~TRINITY_DN37545_c0_g1_i2.p2  ORF type:complete len:104 (-),score=9.52 TRINITY_DN37545_c0_g1_i2:870-1181(-)